MTGKPNWDLFPSFLAVAQLGSLSAAARRLGTTQPTVGRHIETLEKNLGITLFTRSPAGLFPNSAALELIPFAESMAASADSLIRRASSETSKEQGIVRITASDIVGGEMLPAIWADFHRIYPDIVLELSLTNTYEDMLRKDADIAIRILRPTQGALIASHVGPVDIGLYAHRDYIAAMGLPENLDQLEGKTLIGFDRNLISIRVAERSGIKISREQFKFRCDNELAQLSALRAGIGIGCCHKPIADKDPNLVPILPGQIEMQMDMWLVMHEDMRSCRRVALLFDHLKEALTNYCRGV